MKIGIVAHVLNGKSGARAPIDLAKALTKQGNEVIFYAVEDNSDKQTVEDLKNNNVKISLINFDKRPIIGTIITAFRLKKQLQKVNHQILSLHCLTPFYIGSKLSGIPAVYTYHGTQFGILNERMMSKILFPLEVLLNSVIWLRSAIYLWGANKCVAISKYTQREARKMFMKKMNYIHWGTEPVKYLPMQDKRENICNILTVSRYTPYKNFHKLIDVFKRVQDSTNTQMIFTIVGSLGSGKYLNYLKSIAPKNVKFEVNISDKQLNELYKQIDIYITADTYLFFGMPVLEAASYGKPVIAYNFGAASELVESGQTGYVVNSYDEFTQKLGLLVENKVFREKMGKKAIMKVDSDFNWDKTAKEYLKIFQNTLKNI